MVTKSARSNSRTSGSVLAAKSDARNDRLRKVNEEVLRKKMQTEAKDLCRPYFQAFGDCAKENGIMVVFKCRQQNQDMSDCMDRHCSEQKFDEYLAARGIVRPKPQPWYAKYIS